MLAAAGCLVGMGIALRTARAADSPASALMATANEKGAVRVIVRLDAPAAPLAASEATASVARAAITEKRQLLEMHLGATHWELVRDYQTMPFVALKVSPEALSALENSSAVRDVVEDRLQKVLLPESAPLVQADQAWAAGYDGSGWTVAVLDTGIESSHPFLAGKVVAEACFSANGSCPNGGTTQIGAGAAQPCNYAPNACRHGTHVAGIAAGRGDDFSGIARGATIISIQVFSRFTGSDCSDDREDPCAKSYTSDTIAALEYVYSLRDTYRIAAANMSLGGDRFFSQAACDLQEGARKEIIDSLRAAGVATVAAAGNDGYTDSLGTPACISSVVSVGATTKSDEIASFSDSASFLSLLAPGTPIYSSVPPDTFTYISGTSQATPHVSGAFAILSQRMGSASVDLSLNALQATGLPLLDSRNGLTKPRIRIFDALESLPSSGSPSGLQVTPDSKHTLVSKDVNGQRWAMATNDGTATVTGNVFSPSGGDPVFLFCERTGSDGNTDPYAEQIDFSCSTASACTSPSCPTDEWTFATTVTLPGSFFLPPLSSASGIASAASESPAATAPSALQITPDQLRILVSKDVGGQRWAITRNADDQTLTGNVYSPDGGDPQFLWCQFLSDDGNPDPSAVLQTYGCSTAQRCTASTCSPDAWAFFSNVTLPGSFFQPH